VQQKSSRQGFPNDLDLEAYICIQKEKISPKQVVFHGIDFRLTPEVVRQIQLARARGDTIRLTSSFLTELRHYVLFNSAIAFSTYYREDDETEEAVMRSLVFLNGEATHQVRSDCLEDSEFVLTITACHHWLVQQLLRQLHFQAKQRMEWVSWLLAALVVAAILLFNWQSFPRGNSGAWLVLLLAVWVVQLAIALFLNLAIAALRRWFLRQILFGAFSRNDNKRRMALAIVDKF
jgi:hypothetical protein